MSAKDPLKISSVIAGSLAHLGIEARLREYRLKKAWAGAVGSPIAKKTSPTKLMGTTVYCAVASAPWMSELTYQKASIIEKLNARLGKDAVTEIVFQPGRIRAQPTRAAQAQARELTDGDKAFIEEALSPVKDEALKERIRRAMEKALKQPPL